MAARQVTPTAAVVLAPITLYLYLAHPGWSWMYLVDPATIPGMAIVPLVVLVLIFQRKIVSGLTAGGVKG